MQTSEDCFLRRYVICCAFSHNACLIASGSNDKSFNVWSIDGLFESRRRHSMDQEHVSDNFVCPITQDIMRNPVKCSDGFIYERAAIQEWIVSRRQTSPMTNLPLENLALVPQPELQMKIRDCVKKSSSRWHIDVVCKVGIFFFELWLLWLRTTIQVKF